MLSIYTNNFTYFYVSPNDNTHVNGRGTSNEFHCDTPGFWESARGKLESAWLCWDWAPWSPDWSLKTNLLRDLGRAEKSCSSRRLSRRKLSADHKPSEVWEGRWLGLRGSGKKSTAFFPEWTRIPREWLAHVHKYISHGSIIHRLTQHLFLPKYSKTSSL